MSKKKRAKFREVNGPSPVTARAAVTLSEPAKLGLLSGTIAVAEPLSLVLFYAFLLSRSWLRWMDPMIDFPRDLYLAWRVSEGDLLYEKVANWYGPLAQLVQAAAFRLFGVGIDTIVWTNIVLTAVVVILLRDIFRTLGNRLSGWLAAVVFLGVFAFGHYTAMANYNFLAPYVAQSTYSFAGLVVVLWGLVHHLKSERPVWLGVAGLGLAVAYLDKPEALLAALGSLGIYFAVHFIREARMPVPAVDWPAAVRWVRPASSWLAGGFFSLWLPVFIYFLARGGLRYAILATNYAPYTVLASRFRHTIITEHSQLGFFGFDQPWHNFLRQLWGGSLFVLVCGVMIIATRAWTRAPKSSIRQGLLVVAIVTGGMGAWLAESQGWHWLDIGAAFVFPVILAAIFTVVGSFRAAWKGEADGRRLLGLAVVGVAAALMLVRMVLNGRIYHFGFFMMPLAVLWMVHLMVVEAARPVPNGLRTNRLLPAVFSALVLAGVVVLSRANLQKYDQKNFEVGEGRDHFYTFAIQVLYNGQLLKDAIKAYKAATPQAQTLVVFPEGIAVNYHLKIRSPLAEMDFLPAGLAYANPAHVLEELKAHPPESIIITARDYAEFGVPNFGSDEASGSRLLTWVNEHYWLAAVEGHSLQTTTAITHDLIDVVKPRAPDSQGVTLLRDANDAPLPSSSP